MESDLSRWTVKQLKDHLRTLGLPVSGNKPVLIQRVESAQLAEISESKYSKMNVKQLKVLLTQRKIQPNGRKIE